jgi:hypothetical protein
VRKETDVMTQKQQQRIHFKKSLKGISLSELLVTVFIFLSISGALYASFAVGQDSWMVNKAQITLNSELRKTAERVKQDLVQAGAASIVDVPADGEWYQSITFRVPLNVVDGGIVWDSEDIVFSLDENNNRLMRTREGVSQVVGQHLIFARFRRAVLTPDILEVSLGASNEELKGDSLESQLDIHIKLRN